MGHPNVESMSLPPVWSQVQAGGFSVIIVLPRSSEEGSDRIAATFLHLFKSISLHFETNIR